ncbi:MAG: IS256 family transposase [Leadbetterella sp.]|nr:IS256 family transposase [Leadbetterella sp.]
MITEGEFNYDDFEKEALDKLKRGVSLEGKDGVLAPLLKRLIDASLQGELEGHLLEEKARDAGRNNRRNGVNTKKVKTLYGPIDITTPRDRNGSFEPEILPKRQTTLGDGLDHKIIGLYALGMSYTDICDHLSQMYQLTLSPATITSITDKILPEIEQWQTRPLESVYPILWLDAIHYKVREDNAIKTKAVYCLIGLNREGVKDLLGMYIGENESARFWLSVLNDIHRRGVNDILIASIDNLKGFAQAIEAVFPHTRVQLCIVHQVRNSLKYVPYKDKKEVAQTLKDIYQSNDLIQAEKALNQLDLQWRTKYPSMVKSWLENWERLSQMFDFPDQIRKLIYTTNVIESFNSQLRKVTKSKRVFTNDRALMKLLFLVQQKIYQKAGAIKGWKQIMAQLIIIFEDRMNVQ